MTEFCDGEKPTYPNYNTYNVTKLFREANTYVQNCVEAPSPPAAVGMKSAFALQLASHVRYGTLPRRWYIPPQDHANVLAGWQYAALAKNENGLKEAICAVDRVLMAWRANKEVSSVGAAETTVATKTMD